MNSIYIVNKEDLGIELVKVLLYVHLYIHTVCGSEENIQRSMYVKMSAGGFTYLSGNH